MANFLTRLLFTSHHHHKNSINRHTLDFISHHQIPFPTMKCAFLFISLLLIGFGFIHRLTMAAYTPEPVLDITGSKLQSGVEYYILPAVHGLGGGLTSGGRNGLCPLGVVPERSEESDGRPLTFSPVDPKKGIIRLSTDQNIKFTTGRTICGQSTVWKLGSFEQAMRQTFISANGVEGNPGPETLDNWFKIEKCGVHYKLMFCPTVCYYCKVICRDIGLGVYIEEGGVRRLALSDIPFKIMFKKVKNDSD